MITTPDLIASLAANATPVRRLRPPLQRAGLWMVFAAVVLVLFTVLHGARADLFERLREPNFALSVAAALMTGILAAVAAFELSLPDRSKLWIWLPGPAVALWALTIGYGCLTIWVGLGPDGVRLGTTMRCFATLVLTGVPLSLLLLVMLRHAALVRPTIVAGCASLAVAGVTAAALSLFHEIDATVMVLLWNIVLAVLMVLTGGAFGRRMFSWVTPRAVPGGH